MLNSLLSRFQELAQPSSHPYPWHHYHDGGSYSFHLIISSIIHGNEVGSLPAVVKLVESLRSGALSFGGKITILLGNPEAARCNVRFLESDLNRMFLPNELSTHESQRASELIPLLEQGDFLIDFHQTILHTLQPFYICPVTSEGMLWARALALTNALVDATPENLSQSTTRCADEFMYERGLPALTIELSEKGFNSSAEELTWRACTRAVELIERLSKSETTLEEAALKEPSLKLYTTKIRSVYPSPHHMLRPGLSNFTPVKQGELLSAENHPELRAEHDGLLLFPKYPPDGKALPKHIYRIIQQKH